MSHPSGKLCFLELPVSLQNVLFNSTETDVKTDVEKSKENKPKAHQKKNGKKVNFPHFKNELNSSNLFV